MQKNLKAKLEKLSRDQLLELLEELSNVPDVQKMIKAPCGMAESTSWDSKKLPTVRCVCAVLNWRMNYAQIYQSKTGSSN